jgi:uncharacterized protein (TIGR03067 family)
MKWLDEIFLVIAVAVAGIGWTAASADDEAAAYKKELEKFAGTWRLVAHEVDGVQSPEADLKHIITGDKYAVELAGKTVLEGWFCFDPIRKPKLIDLYSTRPEGKVSMGIYEWDGDDKLKVCVTDPGTEQARPRLFSTTKGTGHVLAALKREPSQEPSSQKNALSRNEVIAGGPQDFMEVRHLVLKGSNREIGRALAAVASERHQVKPAPSSDRLRTRARNHYLDRQYPILFERMRGVADFYGERLDDDALNLSGLWYVKMRPGCSVVYYPPDVTTDNVSVVSRNSDFSTGTLWRARPGPGELPAAARPYLIEMHPDRGYSSLALCAGDLLSGVLDGINSAGLTVALLADGSERGDPAAEPAFDTGVGLGTFQMQRYLLDTCATTAEAKEALLTTKQYYEVIRCKFLVADRHGTAFIWELSPAANREHILETPGKPLITTNFSLHRHLEGGNLPSAEHAKAICDRYSALAECVGKQTGKFTSDAVKAVHQVAACTEPASPESERPPTRTHWHALYFPELRKMQVSFYLGEKSGESQLDNLGIRRSGYLEFKLTEGRGDH